MRAFSFLRRPRTETPDAPIGCDLPIGEQGGTYQTCARRHNGNTGYFFVASSARSTACRTVSP